AVPSGPPVVQASRRPLTGLPVLSAPSPPPSGPPLTVAPPKPPSGPPVLQAPRPVPTSGPAVVSAPPPPVNTPPVTEAAPAPPAPPVAETPPPVKEDPNRQAVIAYLKKIEEIEGRRKEAVSDLLPGLTTLTMLRGMVGRSEPAPEGSQPRTDPSSLRYAE